MLSGRAVRVVRAFKVVRGVRGVRAVKVVGGVRAVRAVKVVMGVRAVSAQALYIKRVEKKISLIHTDCQRINITGLDLFEVLFLNFQETRKKNSSLLKIIAVQHQGKGQNLYQIGGVGRGGRRRPRDRLEEGSILL